jgi:arylsulfatase A-like enzyme
MTRRSTKAILAFLALLTLLGGQLRAAEPPRPNIVYLVIDNVTFEHMGKAFGGQNLTPAMDSIAERGVRFERMYVPTPLCVPSRYSILSGRYPERCTSPAFLEANPAHESWYEVGAVELETDRPNLPRTLQSAGYRTGFVGKFHNYHGTLGPEVKADGRHLSDPALQVPLRQRNDALAAHIRACGFDWVGGAEWGLGFAQIGTDLDTGGVHHNLEWEVANALEFLDGCKGGSKPFFLYLATRLYHMPFDPEKDLRSDYAEAGRYSDRGLLEKAPAVPMPSRTEIADMAARESRRRDTAGMKWLDFGIRAVLDRIEAIGARDNTLVVLISDNNQPGKSTVYEGGIRVPAAMMWPARIRAGQTCRRIVSSLDIAATLLDAAQAKPPADMQLEGRSFLPMLTDQPEQPWNDVFMAEYGYARGLVTPRWKYVAVRYPQERWEQIRAEDARKPEAPGYRPGSRQAEKWKRDVQPHLRPQQIPHAYNLYRYWHSGDNNHISRVDSYPHLFDADQLYDLEADPGEQTSLAAKPEWSEKLAEMKSLLTRELQKQARPFGEFKPASPDAPKSTPRRKKPAREVQE